MIKSLYIHIPFCRKKCLYCDFYSLKYHSSLADGYIEAIMGRINRFAQTFETIYIGGGTPTVLSLGLLEKLFNALRKLPAKGCEFTVEANPESINEEKLSLFKDCGVNRLSVGLQSFSEEKLVKLGRIHTAKQAVESVFLAYEAGFKNISIDLIFGVWGESFTSWRKELSLVKSLPINHISTYSLACEKGTPLSVMVKNNKIKLLDDAVSGKMYEAAMNYLPRISLNHYEVSNFAKKGFLCRHNLNYWDNSSYIGLGPSAVSFVEGVRSRNISCIGKYLERVKNNKPTVVSREELSRKRFAKETAALKIRTSAGIGFRWFKAKTGFDFFELERSALKQLLLSRLLKYNYIGKKKAGVSLTKKGFLFCDSVSSGFL